MSRLLDKVVLVTGAARGIGLACARAMLDQGARVWLSDIRHDEGTAAAASLGDRAAYLPLDVRIEQHWTNAMTAIHQAGFTLDVLVNNAGITGFEGNHQPQDPENASLETWRMVHATNAEGTFLGCKHAIAAMKPPTGRGGSIVNVSSRSGLVGIAGAVAYAASKAAIRNHTKSVALYCAERKYNIRCNSIHPGAILTPMWDAVLGDGESRTAAIEHISKGVPLGRMGRPEDVAHMVVYLASDESAYVTGAEFTIDGGILAGWDAQPKGR